MSGQGSRDKYSEPNKNSAHWVTKKTPILSGELIMKKETLLLNFKKLAVRGGPGGGERGITGQKGIEMSERQWTLSEIKGIDDPHLTLSHQIRDEWGKKKYESEKKSLSMKTLENYEDRSKSLNKFSAMSLFYF